jgi:predicted dehydrogenase
MSSAAPLRFAAIGLNHSHIYSQVATLLAGGAEFAAFHSPEPDLVAGFARAFPDARQVDDEREILEDPAIAIVTSAAIPSDRAPLGIRAMQHDKDVLMDKPGVTTLDQLAELRRVQRGTGRIYSVFFSERHESRATVRAAELVRGGAIGQVVQLIGLGPHRTSLATRPPWFFQRSRYGGILCDIASHQIDQFLYFAEADDAEILSSLVANYAHPEHPGLEDYGEVHLRAGITSGLARVDWYTPDGLSTWGDGRLFVLGTEGYVEVRKYCDLAGRTGADHLFLVDGGETRRLDCSQVELPFGPSFLDDVRDRTETAMSQAHCFTACELALRAQAEAERRGHLAEVSG